MADATMTIAVRVRDEATAALTAIGGRAGRTLLRPFNAIGQSVGRLVKSMFSLRTLLVGGGGFAILSRVMGDLAKNAKQFEPIFSAEKQQQIDDTVTAWNKLVASFKSVVGEIFGSGALASSLNKISDWFRDNKKPIVELVEYFVWAFTVGLPDAASKGADAVVAAMKRIWAGIARPETAAAGPYSGIMDRPLDFSKVPGGTDSRSSDILKTSFPPGTQGLPPEFQWWLNDAPKATQNIDALNMVLDDYREPMGQFNELNAEAAPIVKEVTKAVDASKVSLSNLTVIIDNGIIQLREYADIVADSFTEGFFAIIEGTKSVARAFADMVTDILREVGRLLINRAVASLVFGLIAGGVSAGTTATGVLPGEATSSGVPVGGLRGGFAVGGTSRGGSVMVGERGPERVSLPRGARVDRTDQSGGGGGITINVIGARDAKATAAEVIRELEKHGGLRASVKAVARS